MNQTQNYKKATIQQMHSTRFIKMLHKLWLADIGDLDDYMTAMEALMIEKGVHFKQFADLESDYMDKALMFDLNIDSVFAYEVNDKSKDIYENFERVCLALFDFSGMYSLTNKAA